MDKRRGLRKKTNRGYDGAVLHLGAIGRHLRPDTLLFGGRRLGFRKRLVAHFLISSVNLSNQTATATTARPRGNFRCPPAQKLPPPVFPARTPAPCCAGPAPPAPRSCPETRPPARPPGPALPPAAAAWKHGVGCGTRTRPPSSHLPCALAPAYSM